MESCDVFTYILHDDVSERNSFQVTGPLWGDSTSHRWVPLTKATNAKLGLFPWARSEKTAEQTVDMLVNWDAMALIITSL